MTISNFTALAIAERVRNGHRAGQPTYSAKPGGTTLNRDKPLGLLARLARWWRGGRS